VAITNKQLATAAEDGYPFSKHELVSELIKARQKIIDSSYDTDLLNEAQRHFADSDYPDDERIQPNIRVTLSALVELWKKRTQKHCFKN